MIDKMLLEQVLTKGMEGTDLFIVDVTIGKDNNIVVEIDSDTSVDIDECVRLTRLVESHFDRDKEDYDLEIGSAGLTSPLKVERQYHKNIGNEVEVLTADGRKLKGVLKAVDSEGFVLTTEQKVKKEGQERPVVEAVDTTFRYEEIKYTKYIIQF